MSAYINKEDEKNYKSFKFILKIIFLLFIVFVIYLVYAIFLYKPIAMIKVYSVVNGADTVYVNVKPQTEQVSADDAKKLIDAFKNAEFIMDGRGVGFKCGFGERFSVQFTDSKTGRSIYACRAQDGCGGFLINGDLYDLTDEYSDECDKILKKYGMGHSY